MDFAVAIGAVQIAATAIQMLTQLNSVYTGISKSPYRHPNEILSELPILISMLKDIQNSASNSSTEPPRTVIVAMQISRERFKELLACLTYMGIDPKTGQSLPGKRPRMYRVVQIIRWSNTGPLQDATVRFRSAVTLLRDIAMDHRTHDLLIQQQAFLRFESTKRLKSGDTELFLPDNRTKDLFEPVPKNIRVDEEGQNSLGFGTGTDTLTSVTFSFDVPDGDRPRFYTARAKYDTGCDDCLITETVIEDNNLHGYLVDIEEREYVGIGYAMVTSQSQITLSWSAHNEALTRRNTFYVVPNSPFELLLGKHFVNANLLPALPACRMFNYKDKAQKILEAEKEAEDELAGEELASRRRRGKAPQRPKTEEIHTTNTDPQLEAASPLVNEMQGHHGSSLQIRKTVSTPLSRKGKVTAEPGKAQSHANSEEMVLRETPAATSSRAEVVQPPPEQVSHDVALVPDGNNVPTPPCTAVGTVIDAKFASADSGYMSGTPGETAATTDPTIIEKSSSTVNQNNKMIVPASSSKENSNGILPPPRDEPVTKVKKRWSPSRFAVIWGNRDDQKVSD